MLVWSFSFFTSAKEQQKEAKKASLPRYTKQNLESVTYLFRNWWRAD